MHKRNFMLSCSLAAAALLAGQAMADTGSVLAQASPAARQLMAWVRDSGDHQGLPFIVIDLIVANILLALGMSSLSPVTVSLPLKLLLFVLVDGWHLVVRSLVQSFAT